MRLIEFLERESDRPYRTILLVATLSGLANALLVYIANHATEAMVNQASLVRSLFMYAVAFSLFLQTQWYAFTHAIALIEEALYNKRARMTKKVSQLAPAYIEAAGGTRLYARLTQNDALISQAVPQLVPAFQMASLTVFSLFYLAWLAPATCVVTLAALGLGVWVFVSRAPDLTAALARVRDEEDRYCNAIAELIEGGKETERDRRRIDALIGRSVAASAEAQAGKVEVHHEEARLWGLGRLLIYLLLPIALFLIPTLSEAPGNHLFKVSALLLFLIGPITLITSMVPLLMRVQLALDDLFALEQEMDAASARSRAGGSA